MVAGSSMLALFAVAVEREIVGRGRFAGVIWGEFAPCCASEAREARRGQKDCTRRLLEEVGRILPLSAGEKVDEVLEKGLDNRRGIACIDECSVLFQLLLHAQDSARLADLMRDKAT